MKKFSSLNESVEPKFGIKEPIKNDLYNLIEKNVTVKMTGGDPEQLSNVDITIEGKEKLTEEIKNYIEKTRVKERILTLEMVRANIHRNFDMKWLNETIENLNKVNEHLDISDDLKSNFRSWEADCDNEQDADKLFGILMERHPKEDPQIVKQMAYHWVGYTPPQAEE